MSASEWFGTITNPESIAAIGAAATALSGAIYAIGKTFIKLYKDVKSGKKTLLDAFKEGEEYGIKLAKEVEKLNLKPTEEKKGDKKAKKIVKG